MELEAGRRALTCAREVPGDQVTLVWKGKGAWPPSRNAVLRQDRTSIRDPVSVLLDYIVLGSPSKDGVGLALGSHEFHFRVRHRNGLNRTVVLEW